jgi:hypothetical protein
MDRVLGDRQFHDQQASTWCAALRVADERGHTIDKLEGNEHLAAMQVPDVQARPEYGHGRATNYAYPPACQPLRLNDERATHACAYVMRTR